MKMTSPSSGAMIWFYDADKGCFSSAVWAKKAEN